MYITAISMHLVLKLHMGLYLRLKRRFWSP